jgi:hypothetical protein
LPLDSFVVLDQSITVHHHFFRHILISILTKLSFEKMFTCRTIQFKVLVPRSGLIPFCRCTSNFCSELIGKASHS